MLPEIKEQNGKQVVSAIALYEFLGLAKQHWAKWYKKNITNNYTLTKNVDYFELPPSGRTRDFAITTEFANKVSMLARTEKGEQARKYFINCERKAKNPIDNISKKDLIKLSKKWATL